MRASSRPLTIGFHVPPRLDRTLSYQRYYLLGLEKAASVSVRGGPLPLRIVPGVDRKLELERRLRPLLSRLREPQATAHVGRYVASDGRRSVSFAIDAHDRRDVFDPVAQAESDIYFKANRWSGDALPDNVLPIVNGNGLLGLKEIAFLRGLRGVDKDLDLVFISRVWGGVEHNLRLFEQVAPLGLRSELRAIIPMGAPDDLVADSTRRLAACGVSTGTEDLPRAELWRLLARAKVVLLRAGMKLCVPWRMLDLLCMGACVVVDSIFRPEWPVPLRPGANYLDCGVDRPDDTSPAPEERYVRVAETIVGALARPDLRAAVQEANARYFDEHAAPERVGVYIVDQLRGLLEA